MKLVFDRILSPERAATQFDEMMIQLVMMRNGCSREEAVRRRKIAAAEYKERQTQESIAQVWP